MVVAAAPRTRAEISTRIRSRRPASRFDSGSSQDEAGVGDQGAGERNSLLLVDAAVEVDDDEQPAAAAMTSAPMPRAPMVNGA
jgi:hypothetical protein